jgi:uncharacterized protein YggU (UPF0235/DUF167 family)
MYIRVKVLVDQKEDLVEKISDNEFKISVREKAERGEANKKVLKLIQTEFNNPEGGVRIINGHHSPVKLLKVGKD